MIENKFVKKIISGVIKNRNTNDLDRSIMHPAREWFAGLFVGFVCLLVVAVWSGYSYQQFRSLSVEGSDSTIEVVVYKQSLVEAALTDFEIRKNTYNELKSGLLENKNIDAVEAPKANPDVVLEEAENDESTQISNVNTSEAEAIVETGEAQPDFIQFQ
jgi:cell division septal protein FtsQ